jgi:hypothetical protein
MTDTPDVLAVIEARERDVKKTQQPRERGHSDSCIGCGGEANACLAALGEPSVALARAVWDAHSGRDQLGAGCEVCEALLAWAQAGEERDRD